MDDKKFNILKYYYNENIFSRFIHKFFLCLIYKKIEMFNKNSNYIDDCPICGGKIWKPSHIIVEGVRVTVCQSCSKLGQKTSITSSSKTQSKIFFKKPIRRKSVSTPHIARPKVKKDDESDLQIVSDFAVKIKKAREKNKLTQEKFALKLHEKESLIRSLENGKRIPTISLAKKIEKTYNVKLIEKKIDDESDYRRYIQQKKAPTTLGDMIVIRKKKKSDN